MLSCQFWLRCIFCMTANGYYGKLIIPVTLIFAFVEFLKPKLGWVKNQVNQNAGK